MLTLNPNEIADVLGFLKGKKDQTLAAVTNEARTNGRGYLVGVAKRNEPGYKPTTIVIETANYNQANKIVEEANAILFPERSLKDNAIIVLSSMRK